MLCGFRVSIPTNKYLSAYHAQVLCFISLRKTLKNMGIPGNGELGEFSWRDIKVVDL